MSIYQFLSPLHKPSVFWSSPRTCSCRSRRCSGISLKLVTVRATQMVKMKVINVNTALTWPPRIAPVSKKNIVSGKTLMIPRILMVFHILLYIVHTLSISPCDLLIITKNLVQSVPLTIKIFLSTREYLAVIKSVGS